jgi:hypothetical protein
VRQQQLQWHVLELEELSHQIVPNVLSAQTILELKTTMLIVLQMNVHNTNMLMLMDNVKIAKLDLFQISLEELVLYQYSIAMNLKSIVLMEETAENVDLIPDLKIRA